MPACSPKYLRATAEPTGTMPAHSVSRHVIVVSVDGLRPDAITEYKPATMVRLMEEGSYTLAARTIDPSKTLPSHTSMLTGQPPERHGVRWNTVVTAQASAIKLPNMFSVARSHGYRTAAFFSKPKFQPLQLPDTLDYTQAPGGLYGGWSSARTVTDVATYLETAAPNLLFVHLPDPDLTGHQYGWMTRRYADAVRAADAGIARLITLAERRFGAGDFTLIVTADHGGHDDEHGSTDPRDVTIPWIAWGQGVKPGQLPGGTIRTMDTAATALWLLGVEAPSDWAGRPVTAAYTEPAVVAQH